MIALNLFQENPELIRKNLLNRGHDTAVVDQVVLMLADRKSLLTAFEQKKAKINDLSNQIGVIKKAKGDASLLMKEVHALKSENEITQTELDKVLRLIENQVLALPNILQDKVPVGTSEADNRVMVKSLPPATLTFPPKDHAQLGEELKMLDFETASKITGARFVVYKGMLAKLERALINFMLDFHSENGYEEVIPPFIVKSSSLVGTGNLPKFQDQLFKIEGHDWYLIPTAEVPLTNFVREEILNAETLPHKYAAYTPCFRSEAGAHGKDVKGLIRLHQFNKVEMVQIVHPDKSDVAHEMMIHQAMDILSKLNLPFQALELCSADTGFGSTRTIDLEVWVPSQQKYREISSISNCGDFQARRAGIRFRDVDGKVKFAHTLNGSGLAVGRTVVAIMENYQNQDGSITIPEVLRPYMQNQTIIKLPDPKEK